MTYVGADSFGFVSGQVSRSGKRLWNRRVKVVTCDFADIDGGAPGETELKLHKQDGTIASVRRPIGLPPADWKRWLIAVVQAFEEARWSHSLYQLAFWHTRSAALEGLPDCARLLLTPVMFDVISVIGNRSPHGPDVVQCPNGQLMRLPTGRLGYSADGIIFENWMPLYRALNLARRTVEGIELARQPAATQADQTDVGQIVETWRNEHTQYFPVADIESIEETDDGFTLRTRGGRAIEFTRNQVIGCDTLLRLMRSSIWAESLAEELRRELAGDVAQLQQSPGVAGDDELIFGNKLPKHRAFVWYSAFRLGQNGADAQESVQEVMRAAFRDSHRALGRYSSEFVKEPENQPDSLRQES